MYTRKVRTMVPDALAAFGSCGPHVGPICTDKRRATMSVPTLHAVVVSLQQTTKVPRSVCCRQFSLNQIDQVHSHIRKFEPSQIGQVLCKQR
jgi:hypothetical protein